WHEPDALGDHRLHVFRRDVVAVLHSIDAGFNSIVYSQQPGGMRRYTGALTVGFVHDGAELVERERWNRFEDIVMNPAAAIGVNLDPIDAMRKLFPHCLARAFDPIHGLDTNRYGHIPGIGRLQRIRASYVHGTTHHLHARSPD